MPLVGTPTTIVVGPIPYTLVSSPEDDHVLTCEHRVGEVDLVEQKIRIHSHCGEDQKRVSLFHEILHACINNVGSFEDRDHDEAVCEKLSAILVDVLRRNPDLVSYLTKETAP